MSAKTAVVGIGATKPGQIPGQSANEIAVRAVMIIDWPIDKDRTDVGR